MMLSILIRNLNEESTLKKTIFALKNQHVNFDYEIVVVDNESDDNSVLTATGLGCSVFTLARNKFTFGKALNFGIVKCSGQFILILSAHIILLNEFFLQNIPKYFNDEEVGGLRFIQATDINADSAIFEKTSDLVFDNSSLFIQKNWKFFLVNHCAAIRKTTWNEVKFNDEIFASEDKLWSLEILKKGWKIVYNVPCFYTYIKPLSRNGKIKRMIIEEAGKKKIDPDNYSVYNKKYSFFILNRILYNFKKSVQDLKIYNAVYKGVKFYRK